MVLHESVLCNQNVCHVVSLKGIEYEMYLGFCCCCIHVCQVGMCFLLCDALYVIYKCLCGILCIRSFINCYRNLYFEYLVDCLQETKRENEVTKTESKSAWKRGQSYNIKNGVCVYTYRSFLPRCRKFFPSS